MPRLAARGKEDIVKFQSFEKFAELERFQLRRTGVRLVVATAVGAAILAAVIMALPFG